MIGAPGIESGADVVDRDLDSIASAASAELGAMAGDRLLIVGGGGFVGYYLINSILRWNQESSVDPIRVTVFDSWIRGRPAWLSRHLDDPSLEVETVDITLPVAPRPESFQWIAHAASIASPIYYRKHPIETMDANVNGLRHLLELALAQSGDLRGFLFFSTSEIYGDPPPEAIPTPETFRGYVSCTGPRACYDESKRYGETLSVNFADVHGLPVKTVRPFNNYGPGLKLSDGRVIPDFCSDVLANRDINLLSSGSPTRTFCYIADAVVGYLKALVKGRTGEAYNIGTEEPEISMSELASLLVSVAEKHLGYQRQVVRATSNDPEYLTDNPNRRRPSIDKARSELGYQPEVAIEDGLLRTLLWYRDVAHLDMEAE